MTVQSSLGRVIRDDSPGGAWPLDLVLTENDQGTRPIFTHHLDETDDSAQIGPGRHFYLDRLAAALAGDPVPEDWNDYYPALATRYAATD